MNVSVVVRALTTLIWILFIGVIAIAVVRASRGKPVRGVSIAIVVIGILALVFTSVSAGLVFIQPEERGVVISAVNPDGYRSQPLQPGLNWIVPFFESVVTYPISKQTYTMSIAPLEGQIRGDDSVTARTADGQEIFVDASVIFAVDPSEVVPLHITWQNRYVDDLVRPLSRGVIRGAVSQFGVQEVYSTKRDEMTQLITQDLSQDLSENGLFLSDFVLRNITFSPEYAASVEQKQIAEQEAEQAKFVVDQRKQEAEQARQVAQGRADAVVIDAEGFAEARVIEAQAEAEALSLIDAVLQGSPDLLTYQYITKLSPNIQAMLLPSNTPYLLPLPALGPLAPGDNTSIPAPQPTTPPTTSP
ncbi:MAG: prohibitin family protein [Anaerolineales bacterium]|nr:prohibitin family protein [Anaerolineales bacterium]